MVMGVLLCCVIEARRVFMPECPNYSTPSTVINRPGVFGPPHPPHLEPPHPTAAYHQPHSPLIYSETRVTEKGGARKQWDRNHGNEDSRNGCDKYIG